MFFESVKNKVLGWCIWLGLARQPDGPDVYDAFNDLRTYAIRWGSKFPHFVDDPNSLGNAIAMHVFMEWFGFDSDDLKDHESETPQVELLSRYSGRTKLRELESQIGDLKDERARMQAAIRMVFFRHPGKPRLTDNEYDTLRPYVDTAGIGNRDASESAADNVELKTLRESVIEMAEKVEDAANILYQFKQFQSWQDIWGAICKLRSDIPASMRAMAEPRQTGEGE